MDQVMENVEANLRANWAKESESRTKPSPQEMSEQQNNILSDKE